MSDSDSGLEGALEEVQTAKDSSAWAAARMSLSGWREMVGSSLGFATFVDLLTIFIGVAGLNAGGIYHFIGIVFLALGAIGILEKVARRVIA